MCFLLKEKAVVGNIPQQEAGFSLSDPLNAVTCYCRQVVLGVGTYHSRLDKTYTKRAFNWTKMYNIVFYFIN